MRALAFLCLPAAVKTHFQFFPFSLVHLSSFSFFRAPGGFRFLLLSLRGACFLALRFLLPAQLAGAQGDDLQGIHRLSLFRLLLSFRSSALGHADSFLVGCTLMMDAVAFLVTQLADAQGDDLHVIHLSFLSVSVASAQPWG